MTKSLSKAIALAATLGAAASAQAVNVNQDGLGQVLLYPIYTAEEGNVTAVHVTNTTNAYKAVKVRFVEGMNSQEVLDFNLYLSPFDVWTGGVIQTATGAALVTSDKSCTAGALQADGQPFVSFLFDGSYQGTVADSIKTLDRTRVGHLEVIEMGEIVPTTIIAPGVTAQAAIEHKAGVPGNCEAVRSSWNTGGQWFLDKNFGVTAPTGGLYGNATVINVQNGTEIGYDATAINNFAITPLHEQPGDEAPSLADAQPFASFSNGASRNYLTGIDAVSAVLMKESIKNDYAFGAGLAAQTDFVITFPTKSLYVNNGYTGSTPNAATLPFTAPWSRTDSSACEQISVNYFNREEGTKQLQVGQISPRPPQGTGIALCYETNVFSVGTSKILGGQFVRTALNLDSAFDTGWMNVGLTGSGIGRTLADAGGVITHLGLPVIGFAITSIQNGDVDGLLSNYAGSWTHKATATVVTP
jgi:hypothetical protein